MKIELDIPDWLIGEGRQTRGIFVMAGIEPVAIKLPGQPWKVKTGRCSNCGKCCEHLKVVGSMDTFPPITNGICNYLIPDGQKKVCSLGLSRPFGCSIALCSKEGCTVTYETLKA